MSEQAHSTKEALLDEEANKEVDQNTNAEQTKPEEGGSTFGKEESKQIDFEQMYNMLTERDSTIKTLKSEISELKKANTNLLLKVNAAGAAGAPIKTPYQNFIDGMVTR